jgi:hypothetical protein
MSVFYCNEPDELKIQVFFSKFTYDEKIAQNKLELYSINKILIFPGVSIFVWYLAIQRLLAFN